MGQGNSGTARRLGADLASCLRLFSRPLRIRHHTLALRVHTAPHNNAATMLSYPSRLDAGGVASPHIDSLARDDLTEEEQQRRGQGQGLGTHGGNRFQQQQQRTDEEELADSQQQHSKKRGHEDDEPRNKRAHTDYSSAEEAHAPPHRANEVLSHQQQHSQQQQQQPFHAPAFVVPDLTSAWKGGAEATNTTSSSSNSTPQWCSQRRDSRDSSAEGDTEADAGEAAADGLAATRTDSSSSISSGPIPTARAAKRTMPSLPRAPASIITCPSVVASSCCRRATRSPIGPLWHLVEHERIDRDQRGDRREKVLGRAEPFRLDRPSRRLPPDAPATNAALGSRPRNRIRLFRRAPSRQ